MLYDSFRQPKGEEKLGRKANAGIPHDGDKPINAGRHPLVTPDSDVAFSFDLHKPTVIRHIIRHQHVSPFFRTTFISWRLAVVVPRQHSQIWPPLANIIIIIHQSLPRFCADRGAEDLLYNGNAIYSKPPFPVNKSSGNLSRREVNPCNISIPRLVTDLPLLTLHKQIIHQRLLIHSHIPWFLLSLLVRILNIAFQRSTKCSPFPGRATHQTKANTLCQMLGIHRPFHPRAFLARRTRTECRSITLCRSRTRTTRSMPRGTGCGDTE